MVSCLGRFEIAEDISWQVFGLIVGRAFSRFEIPYLERTEVHAQEKLKRHILRKGFNLHHLTERVADHLFQFFEQKSGLGGAGHE